MIGWLVYLVGDRTGRSNAPRTAPLVEGKVLVPMDHGAARSPASAHFRRQLCGVSPLGLCGRRPTAPPRSAGAAAMLGACDFALADGWWRRRLDMERARLRRRRCLSAPAPVCFGLMLSCAVRFYRHYLIITFAHVLVVGPGGAAGRSCGRTESRCLRTPVGGVDAGERPELLAGLDVSACNGGAPHGSFNKSYEAQRARGAVCDHRQYEYQNRRASIYISFVAAASRLLGHRGRRDARLPQ